MPSARVRTTSAVKPGLFTSVRKAYLMSCCRVSKPSLPRELEARASPSSLRRVSHHILRSLPYEDTMAHSGELSDYGQSCVSNEQLLPSVVIRIATPDSAQLAWRAGRECNKPPARQ